MLPFGGTSVWKKPDDLWLSLQRFGPPNQDYYYKKSDDPQPDGPEDYESPPTLSDYGKSNAQNSEP